MPSVRYLSIRFDQNIFPYEIHRFRAAVIEKTRRAAPHFHNHQPDGSSIYRYPLIQYKVTFRKASIVCLNEGADEIHHLFQQPDIELRVGDKQLLYSVENLEAHYHRVQLWQHSFDYCLLNWLALNQHHHQRWQELEDDPTEQINLLQSILTGNILAFAKGIGWHVEAPLQVEITKIKQIKPLPFKGRKMLAFTLNFRSNASLPNYIGLGKGASVGFGVVKRVRPEKENSNFEAINFENGKDNLHM